jgi:hypothetical protein
VSAPVQERRPQKGKTRRLNSEVSATDAVEAALADALTAAAQAQQWDVVARLADELQARRRARQAPEVVDLAEERVRRGER